MTNVDWKKGKRVGQKKGVMVLFMVYQYLCQKNTPFETGK